MRGRRWKRRTLVSGCQWSIWRNGVDKARHDSCSFLAFFSLSLTRPNHHYCRSHNSHHTGFPIHTPRRPPTRLQTRLHILLDPIVRCHIQHSRFHRPHAGPHPYPFLFWYSRCHWYSSFMPRTRLSRSARHDDVHILSIHTLCVHVARGMPQLETLDLDQNPCSRLVRCDSVGTRVCPRWSVLLQLWTTQSWLSYTPTTRGGIVVSH